ncbi:hypothetical protein BDU57DRAFT_543035 [Ampelomyces quisqualis]|uniref:Uncharacterized protein n=1 Tax=Ampelomyces quisqualis TaxID=50730 RepID=A0A6A5Q9Y2_AMPQU|nr:hypothetical protein BDU57DRAFT_543035 [Ampelomyces quisqualis]
MGKAAAENLYSGDVVAAVLAASGTTSLTMKQYEMMSAMDGTRTASGFQHAFRAVIAKSKELKARVDAGEAFEPVVPATKRGGTSTKTSPATPRKRMASADDDAEDTPSRKKATPRKSATPKKRAAPKKNASQSPINDCPSDEFEADAANFLEHAHDFIKHEKLWEDGYV